MTHNVPTLSQLLTRTKQEFASGTRKPTTLFGGSTGEESIIPKILSVAKTTQLTSPSRVAGFIDVANTNFANIQTSFTNFDLGFRAIADSLTKLGVPPSVAPAQGTGTDNTSKTPSTETVSNTDKVIDSLEQFKNFLGPIGLVAILGLGVLIILKR